MIVADTNLVAYLFIPGTATDLATAVLRKDPDWVAPPLWRSEFRSVLAGYIRQDLLSPGAAVAYARDAETLLTEHEVDAADVLRLVAASTRSAYGCEFVALAERLGVPLVTADRAVARDFPGVARSPEAFVAG
ncbi:MAG: type II toxin-antitoxin system VapC family toxin [Rhodothermales bacterium]|nr:type II toxin-antitoxin system VapC family toxin [Rhodothermales bacterium]